MGGGILIRVNRRRMRRREEKRMAYELIVK
jgi:hypothetical protein